MPDLAAAGHGAITLLFTEPMGAASASAGAVINLSGAASDGRAGPAAFYRQVNPNGISMTPAIRELNPKWDEQATLAAIE